MADFARLSTNWTEWAARAGLSGATASTDCDDCAIIFRSSDYSVHLREAGNWWVIDKVDDRGHRNNEVAKFSTFELAEKYLVWDWVTLARSSLASGPLGTDLYRMGYAPGVEVSDADPANIEVRYGGDCGVLVSGDATIFSHVMKKSVAEIESIARSGLS
jgi:hypothetical protein